MAALDRARRTASSLASNRQVQIWILVWLVTRALMVVQVGFWNHVSGAEVQDVNLFASWSHVLAVERHMPLDENWQYPPGAAFLMLLSRISFAPYAQSFVAVMLLLDFVGLVLLGILAKQTHRIAGLWIWLLGVPLLGPLAILRLDLVPTVLAIAALMVIHRRPGWFGALAGLGAAVIVWPVVLLFGEWNRNRLIRSIAVAAGVIALVFAVATGLFGSQSTFIENRDAQGLEFESVTATPWFVRNMVTGQPVPELQRHGVTEVASPLADTAAVVLKWLAFVVLIGAVLWWRARDRAVHRGRSDLEGAEISRDFVFTLLLLLVVVSRVLTPQYMIWMVGLSAVILSGGSRRMARPAWLVVFALFMSSGLYVASANVMLRNLALLAASLDAAVGLVLLLRNATDKVPDDGDNPLPSTVPRSPSLGRL